MKEIGQIFLDWYTINKRKLPWRETKDPYHIWISEIILQQTRVDQGLNYYLKFVKRFPNVEILANSHEDEVLKYWQGLGYYSRARNLHLSAKYIYNELEGHFPTTYEEIKKLKGVGPYTASAIASIAFDLPHPVVDGNVLRVISRIFGVKTPVNSSKGLKIIEDKVHAIFIKKQAADFNQAMMEFGALYCKPNNPECQSCIFNTQCIAYRNNTVKELPIKEKARKPKNLYLYYFVFINKNREFIIQKRNDKGIWKNMYEFPCLESDQKINTNDLLNNNEFKTWIKNGDEINDFTEIELKKHQLSHKSIYAKFLIVFMKDIQPLKLTDSIQLINLEGLKTLPVSKLIDNFITLHLQSFIQK